MAEIAIEIAYGHSAEQQTLLKLSVVEGITIEQAIQQSGILQQFPEIDLQKNPVGIFSKKAQLTDIVRAGDRIEIYRPLIIDPKQARRARVKK